MPDARNALCSKMYIQDSLASTAKGGMNLRVGIRPQTKQ